MKYIIKNALTILCLLLVASVNAQTPQGIPYQAAASDSSGAILASTNISVRFTIRDSIATGTIKYQETHSVTTTAQGMFSVNVGQGTVVAGTFAAINWGTNAKYMQVELDPAGGSTYLDIGTQQMMSVPYALSSESVKLKVSITGDTVYSGAGNILFMPGISLATYPLPTVAAIIGTATVTVGTTSTLSNATTGGTWSSSATGIATVSSTGIVTGVAVGTATISYTVTNIYGSTVATMVVSINPLTVGTTYGGGKVAYIFVPGDAGYVSGETHGLIAATSDQGTGVQWGGYGTLVAGTSTALGTGAANTTIVSAACGAGTPARLCEDLVLSGYSDWYLPSIVELQKLYNNRVSIGGFTTSRYWSSSQSSVYNVSTINFIIGIVDSAFPKYNTGPRWRAIRSF